MDTQTFSDIRTHSQSLLRASGIKRPPTALAPLLAEKQLELFGFSLPSDANLPQRLEDSIRAFIDISDRHIFISRQLHKKQQRFASFHEIGHYVLPWHRKTFYACSEMDLSPAARKIFDKEANAFAAECVFQGDAFAEDAMDCRFGMRSIMAMADCYNVSFESAGRRFVEGHPDPCAFVVCEPISAPDGIRGSRAFRLKYAVRSDTFPCWFQAGSILPPDHVISRICAQTHDAPVREKLILDGTVSLSLKCNAYVFFNGYKALILLNPRNFCCGRSESTQFWPVNSAQPA